MPGNVFTINMKLVYKAPSTASPLCSVSNVDLPRFSRMIQSICPYWRPTVGARDLWGKLQTQKEGTPMSAVNYRRAAKVALLSTVLASCGGGGGKKQDSAQAPQNGDGTRPAFAQLSGGLLKTDCVSCHNAARRAAGVDLSSYAAVLAARGTNGKPIVVPGAPEASSLLTVITSGSMPPNGVKPAADQIELLRAWIAAGATEQGVIASKATAATGTSTATAPAPAPVAPAPAAAPAAPAPVAPAPVTRAPVPAAPAPAPATSTATTTTTAPTATVPAPTAPAPTAPATVTTFADVTSALFKDRCVGCHRGARAAAQVDLTNLSQLVARGTVVPGSAKTSPLMQSLEDGSMPPYGPSLDADVIAKVRTWIDAGAK